MIWLLRVAVFNLFDGMQLPVMSKYAKMQLKYANVLNQIFDMLHTRVARELNKLDIEDHRGPVSDAKF